MWITLAWFIWLASLVALLDCVEHRLQTLQLAVSLATLSVSAAWLGFAHGRGL